MFVLGYTPSSFPVLLDSTSVLSVVIAVIQHHPAVVVDIHCFLFICYLPLAEYFRIIVNYQTLFVDVILNPISHLVGRDFITMHGPLFSCTKWFIFFAGVLPISSCTLVYFRRHSTCNTYINTLSLTHRDKGEPLGNKHLNEFEHSATKSNSPVIHSLTQPVIHSLTQPVIHSASQPASQPPHQLISSSFGYPVTH